MTTHIIYLALGSNLGDRHTNLVAALRQLQGPITITRVSSIYETEPIGYLAQPHFLNLVCQGQTSLPPHELLHQAKAIESVLGRQATFRNGPRPIDIDILLYDDLKLHTEHLTIPHPRMHERAFVLIPLAEIAPELVEPVSGKTVMALLHTIVHEGVTKIAPAPMCH